MPNTRVEDAPSVTARIRDITSWGEGDITTLNAREKKRYFKQKAAIRAYFTTDESVGALALKHHISAETLEKLAQMCLMQHEDGGPWGFRALMPGVKVVDHAPTPSIHPVAPDEAASTLETAQTGPMTTEAGPIDVIPTEGTPEEAPTQKRTPKAPSGDASAESLALEKATEAGSTATAATESLPDEAVDATLAALEHAAELAEAGTNGMQQTHPGHPHSIHFKPDLSEVAIHGTAQDTVIANSPPSSATPDEEQIEDNDDDEDTAKRQAIKLASQSVQTDKAGDTLSSEQRPLAITAQEGQEQGIEAEETAVAPRFIEGARLIGGAGTQLAPLPATAVGAGPIARGTATLLVPAFPAKRLRVPLKKAAQQRRLVRKRWGRDVVALRQQRQFRHMVSTAVLIAMLLVVVVPVVGGLVAYGAYSHIRGLATDGVDRLLDVKTVLNVSKTNPTAALDPVKLQHAAGDFSKAQTDFIELQQLVNRPDLQAAIVQFAPEYSSKLTMAQRLVQVGLDVSRMGSELSSVAMLGANIIHSSPLASGSNKPLITVTDVSAIEGAMTHALYYINDVQYQMSQVQLSELPISSKQKAELLSALTLLPKARDAIVQAQGLVGIVSWLLGVGQARHFLVQTMDRAELRPGGGFTGQYGVLQIQDGRMAPFNIRDVALLDYAGNGMELGRLPPKQYSWMNFGNFGLRDSNLSGDFPTTARLAMQIFQEEGGGPVDGDIALTPVVISHILQVTGPIKVAEYNEVITAQNLEDRLHYYQQNYTAIALEQAKTHNYGHEARKSFTSLVGKLLLDRVRHLPVSQLMAIAKGAIKDIQSRDLEIYFNNPAAEAWLVEHGYSGAMSTFSTVDGFMVVQANISISKASQFVYTTEQDQIVLDAQGGATHNLTITLTYNQTGPVYGFDTYADYIRVYAPADAQFISGDGFDTGKPLCTPSTSKPPPSGAPLPSGQPIKGCSQYNTSFPSSARYCPNGNYSLGARGYTLNNPKGVWTIDSLGAPTAMTSDLPGRSMWGGLTETPKNCISTITLSWYVPHAVKHVPGQPPYSILVQKQGGLVPTVEIEVDTSAIKGLKPFSYKGNLIADQVFSLPALPLASQKK